MGWGTGGEVDTQVAPSSQILYSDFGVTLKQYQTTTVTEVRGMSEEAAKAAAGVTDGTSSRTYCRVVNGELVRVSVKTGTVVTSVANRDNEANGWKVTQTSETYTCDTTGWAVGGTGGTTGTTVRQSKSKTPSILFSKGQNTSSGTGATNTVYQYEQSVEEQVKNLTQTAAEAMVDSVTNDASYQQVYYKVIDGDLYTFTATLGTYVAAVSNREQDGTYTVTKTTTTLTTSSLTGWVTAFTGTGVTVKTTVNMASSILFSKQGATTIYQVEKEEVTEYRGAGEAICDSVVFSDNTTSIPYYAQIAGEVFSFTATTGTRTQWSATRNSHGVWTGVKRVTTFSTNPSPIPSPWGTAKLDAEGAVISLTTQGISKVVNLDGSSSYEWAVGSSVLLKNVSRKETHVRYISTQAAAQAIVTANTSNTIQYTLYKHLLYDFIVPVYVYRQVPVGTVKTANASYVSPEQGWSVTIVETTYTAGGGGWGI